MCWVPFQRISRASGRCQREEDRVIPKPWKAEMSLGPASGPPGSPPPLLDTMGYHSCPDIPSVPPQYPPTIQPPISGASSPHIITPFKMPHINSAEFHHLPSFEHRSCMIIKDTWSIAIIIDFVPGPKDRRMLSRLSSKGESGDERLMRGWLDVNQGFFSDQTMLAISLSYPSSQYHNTCYHYKYQSPMQCISTKNARPLPTTFLQSFLSVLRLLAF